MFQLPGRNRNSPTLPQTQQDTRAAAPSKTQLIRRRTASSGVSDDEGGHQRGQYRSDSNANDSPYRSVRRGRRTYPSWKNLSRMKLGHILQVVIVLAVTALVWESHHKALFAAEQLSQFKEEESLLLLHLQKIEQQSIQLHENLSRLAQSGVRPEIKAGENEEANGGVDFDLIHKQLQQLYQMEEELNHEVRNLQTRIQQSARNHIIQEFGEGPVQVVLELDFGTNGDGPDRIAILLWHDTPHAAWTWLEQIGRHVWDGASFKWQQGHVIDSSPIREDPMGGKIEFVEQSQHGHEAWTVGVRESENGVMSMYINLQDNTNLHKHETCVGKVIDGFDALQRLLEVARSRRYESDAYIPIRRASAVHVTKKEGLP
jgi:cyclophilin family peptidyl-prolyl cis-trans isomerase